LAAEAFKFYQADLLYYRLNQASSYDRMPPSEGSDSGSEGDLARPEVCLAAGYF
jgi:hypothetical protein